MFSLGYFVLLSTKLEYMCRLNSQALEISIDLWILLHLRYLQYSQSISLHGISHFIGLILPMKSQLILNEKKFAQFGFGRCLITCLLVSNPERFEKTVSVLKGVLFRQFDFILWTKSVIVNFIINSIFVKRPLFPSETKELHHFQPSSAKKVNESIKLRSIILTIPPDLFKSHLQEFRILGHVFLLLICSDQVCVSTTVVKWRCYLHRRR